MSRIHAGECEHMDMEWYGVDRQGSVLMFPQSKGAEQCARNFSDKGLYYFDANDGTKPGICTFHKYYTKQSCPQLPQKYEQLPEKIREILKHNFMEIEDFLLAQTIQVNHAYK